MFFGLKAVMKCHSVGLVSGWATLRHFGGAVWELQVQSR